MFNFYTCVQLKDENACPTLAIVLKQCNTFRSFCSPHIFRSFHEYIILYMFLHFAIFQKYRLYLKTVSDEAGRSTMLCRHQPAFPLSASISSVWVTTFGLCHFSEDLVGVYFPNRLGSQTMRTPSMPWLRHVLFLRARIWKETTTSTTLDY
jgi:hypothetical protein